MHALELLRVIQICKQRHRSIMLGKVEPALLNLLWLKGGRERMVLFNVRIYFFLQDYLFPLSSGKTYKVFCKTRMGTPTLDDYMSYQLDYFSELEDRSSKNFKIRSGFWEVENQIRK